MPQRIVLAVVGSTMFARDMEGVTWASDLIRTYFQELKPQKVISGGAKGIDSLAVRLAESHGFDIEEFLPQQKRWAPHGYMERNLLIAQRCTHLLRIAHHKSTTYGSGWTADRAEEMGKEVYRHLYDPEIVERMK